MNRPCAFILYCMMYHDRFSVSALTFGGCHDWRLFIGFPFDIGVDSGFDDEPDCHFVSGARCHVQRRVSGVVRRRSVGAAIEKQLKDAHVAAMTRAAEKWNRSAGAAAVHIRT